MRTILAGGLIAAAMTGLAAGAQEMPQRGDIALGRQPMIRGTVTSSAPDHLTIKTEEGETYTVALSANTRIIHENRMPGAARSQLGDGPSSPQPMKAQDIKPGDAIAAMGEMDAPKKTVHALFVGVMDAEQVKRLREGLGKEYIVGKIAAMDELKLTILRSDNVSQVIEVDETTSFRKAGRRAAMRPDGTGNPSQGGGAVGAGTPGGESITLADLKVGDLIAGQGSMKHGVFVPTSLTVMPPGATGTRMRRQGPPATQPDAAPNR